MRAREEDNRPDDSVVGSMDEEERRVVTEKEETLAVGDLEVATSASHGLYAAIGILIAFKIFSRV